MDIIPRQARAAYAIREYDATLTTGKTAPDLMHRCNSDCKYYASRTHKVAVCRNSRQTHLCGAGTCTLAVIAADTAMVCPLTGWEVGAHALVQYIPQAKFTAGRQGKCGLHWSTRRKKVRAKQTNVIKVAVRATLQLVFCSPERTAISADAMHRINTQVKRIVASGPTTPSFWVFLQLRQHYMHQWGSLRPPAPAVPEPVVDHFCTSIKILQTASRDRNLELKRTTSCLVLGLCQLLDSGFCPNGATLVASHPWVKAHALSPVQYGKFKSIRCRQQTIAVRQMQRLLVDAQGNALLRLPGHTASNAVTL
jgi:hypothetical protein